MIDKNKSTLFKEKILKLEEEVYASKDISYEDALELTEIDNEDTETLDVLFKTADRIRKKFWGNYFNLCTIINAKSGLCTEDCKYCAQSAHYKTNADVYPLVTKERALDEALKNQAEGAHRFSLVTSGRGLNGKEIETDKLAEIYKHIRENAKIDLCASHGICTKEALQKLYDAGVRVYHHNLEASENFYPNICTTHTYQDRVDTINNAKSVGMSICSGGIFGLGESIKDRIDMAFALKKLGVDSIPINILSPIKGTPLENNKALHPMEILKTVAIFRMIMPHVFIRYAGGRANLGKYAKLGFASGVNSALTGNFLTTTGDTIQGDKNMIKELGYEI